MGHRVHVKSVSFLADDETECYLSFLIDSKNWPDTKSTMAVVLYEPPTAGTDTVLED